MQRRAEAYRRDGKTIGLVPTMGYFHEGHLSLQRRARAECDAVIVSLFVNPTQFGPREDLAAYPADFERDRALAEQERADVMFAPSRDEMYAAGHLTFVEVERLSSKLCGISRPGHFRGVTTVVAKLFAICKPHRAYFGMKDYQQTVIVEQMVRDLNFDLGIVRCPTIREANGLALSSRNSYLSPEQRAGAGVLYRSLCEAQRMIESGVVDACAIRQSVIHMIQSQPEATLDYAEVVDPRALEPVAAVEGPVLVAVAAMFGPARLIDNVVAGRYMRAN